ncbi:MAG: hypothetical protein DMG57_33130 [Acidobacteria bacterium]|nr:MAG: hypothetical protein DMG57_33130 [Acidobacteriota bacterium]
MGANGYNSASRPCEPSNLIGPLTENGLPSWPLRPESRSRSMSYRLKAALPNKLTTDERDHADPDWSPDGTSLVFGGEPLPVGKATSGISVLDLRTNNTSTVSGSEGLFSPHWSPDGRYVAAISSDGQKLLGFDFTTREWADWATIFVGYVNWSRDGRYIYFDSSAGSEPFNRLRISNRKLQRIANLKDLGRQAVGVFGTWTGLAPDDSPLALRDIGSQEIYALDLEAP